MEESEELKEVKWNNTTYKPIKDKNHKFRFTCDKCGECCVENQVILNPYDLIRLSRNKKIPIAELIKNYFGMHIGKESKMPILMVKMLPQCIFQENGICSVYEDRPLVCRSYPVGRMKKTDKKTKEETELWLLNKNCSRFPLRMQELWSIRDWLEKEHVEEYYNVTNLWTSFVTEMCEIPEDTRNKEEWQKNFFVRVYLGYDVLKEIGEDISKLSDKELLKMILDNAKKMIRTGKNGKR